MANLNKVLLIGRLTRDPETRTTPSGATVVAFGLAMNRTFNRRDSGEKVEETTFVDVEAWGRTGETIARYMRKGRQIFVEGRLRLDTWEKDGQRRSKLSVTTENFQFIDSGGGDGGGHSGGGGGRSHQGAPSGGSGGGQDDFGRGGGGGGGGAPPTDDDIPF